MSRQSNYRYSPLKEFRLLPTEQCGIGHQALQGRNRAVAAAVICRQSRSKSGHLVGRAQSHGTRVHFRRMSRPDLCLLKFLFQEECLVRARIKL